MFSSWSLGPLGGRSIAIHPDSFAHIAKAEPPFSWPVAYFYKEVASPESWLDAFKSGDVQGIVCYKDRVHEYLLICVHIPNQEISPVWVRTERHPMKSGIAKMFSQSLDALDTIKFSYDRSKLWNPDDDNIMASAFADLTFRHVVHLLNTIHEVTSIHEITGLNHMWYAGIVMGTLQGRFGKVWLNPPRQDWVKIALRLFGRDTTKATQSVERRFSIRQPSMNIFSLMEQEAWQNETFSRILPTQLFLVDHDPTLHRGPEHAAQSQARGSHSPAEIPFSPFGVPFDSDYTPSASIVQPPPYDASICLASRLMPATFTAGSTFVPPNVVPVKSSSEPSWMWDPVTTVYRPGRQLVPMPTPMSQPPSSNHDRDGTDSNPGRAKDTHPRIVDKFIPSIARADEVPQDAFVGHARQGQQRQPEQAGPSFTNSQPSPPEPPNLTGRILRLGSTPIAIGGYSSVWRGSLVSATSDDPDRSLQVAIKVLRASYTDECTLKRKLHKRLHVEMRIWARLHHENVVRLLGHTEGPEGPGLVSMLYPLGNVLGFLAKNPSVNREIISADVALGLQYLHEHEPPIIHGDLKGPNVLIDADGRASICDFGLSIILDGEPTGHTSSNFGGSLRFLAPELLEESTRNVQTDIYTYACTCIEILFDQEPYHQLSKEAHLMRAILDHRPPIEPSSKEVTFPLFLRILKRCWDHDQSNRPSLNLIIDTIQRCLYHTYRTNLGVHQGIGKRVRFMCLPGIEQANMISVADGGLSIVVGSPTSLYRVPIYQRYRWKLMDTQNSEVSEDVGVSWSHEAESQNSFFTSSSSLLGKDVSSSESPPYISKWREYSEKFRLPYSSMVSYEPYNEATSETTKLMPG